MDYEFVYVDYEDLFKLKLPYTTRHHIHGLLSSVEKLDSGFSRESPKKVSADALGKGYDEVVELTY
jgi:hypothetical protein